MELQAIESSQRVLILGSSGWFGRTFKSLLPPDVSTLCISSKSRDKHLAWDWPTVRNYAPTAIVNFAFVTPASNNVSMVRDVSDVNRELTRKFLACVELRSVRLVLSISSGAAVTQPQTPYGRLKALEEEQLLGIARPEQGVVIGRAYSVSGPYVREPTRYAFSDFILQAQSGWVTVLSRQPTWRRYCAVSDFLRVLWAKVSGGAHETIESGGHLVEMRQLAARIVKLINRDAVLKFNDHTSGQPSIYASDNSQWMKSCRETNIRPLDLDHQIQAVSDFLQRSRLS